MYNTNQKNVQNGKNMIDKRVFKRWQFYVNLPVITIWMTLLAPIGILGLVFRGLSKASVKVYEAVDKIMYSKRLINVFYTTLIGVSQETKKSWKNKK